MKKFSNPQVSVVTFSGGVVKWIMAMKKASCGLSSVALKRTGCGVWQLECPASNVTASVQSDHLLH